MHENSHAVSLCYTALLYNPIDPTASYCNSIWPTVLRGIAAVGLLGWLYCVVLQ